jgi:hypothetical protein
MGEGGQGLGWLVAACLASALPRLDAFRFIIYTVPYRIVPVLLRVESWRFIYLPAALVLSCRCLSVPFVR